MKRQIQFICFLAFFLSSLFAFGQATGSIVGTVRIRPARWSRAQPLPRPMWVREFPAPPKPTSRAHSACPPCRPRSTRSRWKRRHSAPFRKQDVTLLANQSLSVNPKLQVGQTTETVEVTGQQLQVDTSTSTVQNVVEQAQIQELPLNGRNAAQLALTVAGSVNVPGSGSDQGPTKTFPGAVTISVNGNRENQNSYQLDGANYVDEYTNVNQPFPFPDALQEFSVQTSNYTAEYGQNSGAVVNVVTKSGTNAFHGDAFEFVRNKVFNARSWQAVPTASNPDARDNLKRNQFGGTFGGPIIKDKTFFFAGYQGTLLRNVGSAGSTTVPSAAERATATDPATIALLKFIPVGDASGKASFTKPDSENTNQLIGRGDQVLGPNDQLALRFVYSRFTKKAVFDPTNILSYADGSKITQQNSLIHETHVFSGTKVNSFRLSYAREIADRGPDPNTPQATTWGVMLPFYPVPGVSHVRVQNAFSFGDNNPAKFKRNNISVADDFSWVAGRHELHFGAIFEVSRIDLRNHFFQAPDFNFSSMANFLAGKLSGYGSGDSLPAFRQGEGEFKDDRGKFFGVYVQDNLRATRRLTVNLGLRWEPGLVRQEANGRWMQFRLADMLNGVHSAQFPNAPAGLFFPGDAGMPKNALYNNYKLFAPRVGFAWDMFGDGKTSLRGGAGIFYDTRMTSTNNRFVDETPFSPQYILGEGLNAGSFTDPICTQASTQTALGCTSTAANYPFPVTLPPTSSARFNPGDLYLGFDPAHLTWQTPTTYNWNLVVERQLPSGFLVRAGYIGAHSSHLGSSFQQNPYPVGGSHTPGTLHRLNQALVDGPGCILNGVAASSPCSVFGQMQISTFDINSHYNSMQIGLEHRGRSLTVTANYTLSRSKDDSPAVASPLQWDDPARHAFDYGPSDLDHTHRFVATYVFNLPSIPNANGFMRAVFNGWQWGGVAEAQTGKAFTVLAGKDNSGTGLNADRLNLVGQAYGHGACLNATKPCHDLLIPSSFTAPGVSTVGSIATNPYGTTGKGQFRFPGTFNWDMKLQKAFPVTERVRFEFRAEYFNVFNHTNFNDTTSGGNVAKLSSGTSKGNFGAITSSLDPRIGQLALKLFF